MPQKLELGVLVSSHRLDTKWDLRVVLAFFTLVIFTMFLYNWLVLRKRGINLLTYNDILAISLNQSAASVQTKTKLRGQRFFLGTVLVFYFVMSVIYISYIITQHMSFVPDRTVKTIEDIVKRNMPIALQHSCLINRQEFKDIPIKVNTSLILDFNRYPIKRAMLVEMLEIEQYLESANNLDEFERRKFYLLEERVFVYPTMYVLPIHSPFTVKLKETFVRIHETGLTNRWISEELYMRKELSFTHFSKLRYAKNDPRPLELVDFTFPFLLLSFGLIISGIVLVIEIVYDLWKRKKERKEYLELQQRTEEGVMEFYTYLMEQF